MFIYNYIRAFVGVYQVYSPLFFFFQPVPGPMEDVRKILRLLSQNFLKTQLLMRSSTSDYSSLFPRGAFDAHATMAALEHLVDTARENADADILRYNAILRQTRGLAENPVLSTSPS